VAETMWCGSGSATCQY